MKLLRIFLVAAVINAAAGVARATAQASAVHPPAVSDKARADYFRARAALLEAQMHLQQLQSALAQSVEALNAACGATYTATLNPNGDIGCVARPEPKK